MKTIKYFLLAILCIALISCEEEEPVPTFSLSTVSSPAEGGTIIVAPSTASYQQGQSVTLTPQANANWVFKQWEGDGSGSAVPLNISMTSNKSVLGVFVKRDYPLNIQIEGEGTVTEVIVTNPSGREYPHGTTVELTPIPAEGWEFESWGGDFTGNEIPKQITVDKEKNVTVIFKLKEKFYLAENGITCKCEEAAVGEKGFIDGIEYEAVDNDLIRQRRDEGADMARLCTSLVTDMFQLFFNTTFNQPIGNWDVGNVINMSMMFWNAPFNQSVENWELKNAKNMAGMFAFSKFNQPISNWDVSKVENMSVMFAHSLFNQSLGNWDVSNVSNLAGMFSHSLFNQPVGGWDVSKVKYMQDLFRDSPFNQEIGNWDVSVVENMEWMFYNTPFNQPIGDWDVSNVTNMQVMFSFSQFNYPLGNWNVGNVTNMNYLFHNSPFNHPLNDWNVSNVVHMNWVFSYTPFNQPIGNWNVGNVTNMVGMFFANMRFNQDLSKWCVSKIPIRPINFMVAHSFNMEPEPIWGTCPD